MIEIASNSAKGGEDEGLYTVQVLDMTERMASIRTDAAWGIDYLHLVRIDGLWSVVNVFWDVPDPSQG